jgi:hypothetical protein
MSCWTKEQLEDMLEDVVNELNLSAPEIVKQGQDGTPPAKLVRMVLDQKDAIIRNLWKARSPHWRKLITKEGGDANVKDIVTEYLKANGFDGLCNPEIECQCWLKNGPEIMLCRKENFWPVADCVPGHKVMRDDGDWIIKPGKPERKPIKEICQMPHADFSDLKKTLEANGYIVEEGETSAFIFPEEYDGEKPDREWHEDVP